MRFTHKPTIIGGESPNAAHDRLVALNGAPVGRARYYDSGNKAHNHWQWTTQTYPAGSGKANSLDAALAAIRAHVEGIASDSVVRMSGSYADIVVG